MFIKRLIALLVAAALVSPAYADTTLYSHSWSGDADNADLGSSWDENTAESDTAGFKIINNHVEPNSAVADSSETNNAATWSNDQWAQATLGVVVADGSAGPGVGLLVRSATAAITYIALRVNGSGYRVVWKVAGSFNLLRDSTSTTFVTGDTIYLSAVTSGANTTWEVRKNGMMIDGGTLATPIASGRPGILYSSSSGSVELTAFSAGDVVAGGGGVGIPKVVKFRNQQLSEE